MVELNEFEEQKLRKILRKIIQEKQEARTHGFSPSLKGKRTREEGIESYNFFKKTEKQWQRKVYKIKPERRHQRAGGGRYC